MNLIIDIGNTLAKVAFVDADKIIFYQTFKDIQIVDIEKLLSQYCPEKGIVSIVGKVDQTVIKFLSKKIFIINLNHNTSIPIINHYETPETLGYDRIGVAVAASFIYPESDVLVIDCGTAITYDLVTSKGVYIGGAISPGIKLRFKSLNDYTAKLPLLHEGNDFPAIGRNTIDCILSGVLNGVVSEIDGYIDKIKKIYPKITVVLTGGDSNFFANKLKNSIFVNQNLMIIGLNRILEFNV